MNCFLRLLQLDFRLYRYKIQLPKYWCHFSSIQFLLQIWLDLPEVLDVSATPKHLIWQQVAHWGEETTCHWLGHHWLCCKLRHIWTPTCKHLNFHVCKLNRIASLCIHTVICCVVKTWIHLYFTSAFSLPRLHFCVCFLISAAHNSGGGGCESGLSCRGLDCCRLICNGGWGWWSPQANSAQYFVNSEGWEK